MPNFCLLCLLVIGLLNLFFIKKMWLFGIINIFILINLIIKAIRTYQNTIGHLISSPIYWLVIYEIRWDILSLFILMLIYVFLKKFHLL